MLFFLLAPVQPSNPDCFRQLLIIKFKCVSVLIACALNFDHERKFDDPFILIDARMQNSQAGSMNLTKAIDSSLQKLRARNTCFAM